MEEKLCGLDLNSGCGGLALALAPWVRTVALCEADGDAQAVLVSRFVGRDLSLGPIWDDIRTLDGRFFGTAVDIVTATVTGQGVGSGRHARMEGKRGDILLEAKVIGGLRMVEKEEADDKIIGVLANDPSYGHFADVGELPRPLVDRLRHYFLTYKTIPGDQKSTITVDPVYGRGDAHRILLAAKEDYEEKYSIR